MAIIKGTGAITSADYKSVQFIGKTKGGQAVNISFAKSINMGNIDWTFGPKDDVVQAVTFTAVYSNTDATATSTAEPWTIEVDGVESGASEIMLGSGILKIDGVDAGLVRGGGQFVVEREFREIEADGDRGPVEGRIVMEGSRASLTINLLELLTQMSQLFPAIDVTE